ncbi:MAG: alpha/beta hydrolase, partial [Bacilli bacterium]|nr:alpha/beta hydrolase [Bacilli bacterium]
MKEYTVVVMHSTELNRDVRIFIYVPKSYRKSDKFYPVLYMHDGHNLFDDSQATYGKSWGIIEAFEQNPGLPEVIVVGLETVGEERSNELVPFQFKFNDSEKVYGGKTDLYLHFLIEKVKPFIDARYRTYKSAKNTAIMGSSFGGVCSTYAALKYSDNFTRFGCVSNAYHPVQKEMEELCKSADLSKIKKIYMDVGTKESSAAGDSKKYVQGNQQIYQLLKERIDSNN